MLTQNKYDLILLGNAIIDEVYCITQWPSQGTSNIFQSHKISVGGIGNIIESFKNSDLKIMVECVIGNDNNGKIIKKYFKRKNIKTNLHISNKATSKALILSNLELKERTSFVNWGCGIETFLSNKKSKWTHISYLDVIPSLDLKIIKTNSDIISADLCLSNPDIKTIYLLYNQLQYLDYLFISESELTSFLNKKTISYIINEFKLKNLIYHTKNKTFIINKIESKETLEQPILTNDINVLGAGDAYCANFIKFKLNNKSKSDLNAAIYAHQQATKFVLSRSEKI